MIDRLQALSEPTRLEILKILKEQELTAGAVAKYFRDRMSRPAVSQHLRVLKDHGLVWERRKGTRRLYRLRRKGMYEVYKFIEQF